MTPNTLEMALVELCLNSSLPDYAALMAVRIPPGLSAAIIWKSKASQMSQTLAKIRETCLLMRDYVNLYGDGSWTNLILRRNRRVDRGPVDQYNNLCSVLNYFTWRYASLAKRPVEKLRQEGVLPGPSRKFLATDIMAWAGSWGDDAFSDGREPSWSIWLRANQDNFPH